MRSILLAAVVLTGCVDGPSTSFTSKYLSGSYRFSYTSPDGVAANDERTAATFMSPDTVPDCCFEVMRFANQRLVLGVGNGFAETPIPTAGTCPLVAFAQLQLEGVWDGTSDVDLTAANARLVTFVPDSSTGACPRTSWPGREGITRELAVRGQVKLDDLECLNDPAAGAPCAIVAAGSWAIQGVDGAGTVVLDAAGTFEAADEYAGL